MEMPIDFIKEVLVTDSIAKIVANFDVECEVYLL